jgi:two-component system chemotaxis response regulator CheB
MDGLETLTWIMKNHPLPVIMISSFTQDGAKETVRALELGAFDFVTKPAMTISYSLKDLTDELLKKLHAAVQSRTLKRTVSSRLPQMQVVREIPKTVQVTEPKTSRLHQLIAIGTSTGGPAALHEVLSQLDSSLDAPVLIVQHMPANFTKSLAERLNTISGLAVKEAEDGDVLQNGHAYVAPGGYHMTVRKAVNLYKVVLDQSPQVSGHRPSVNKLFESLISLRELKRHIVIMTGMGSDGAESMRKLRLAGATTTIAESEKTCIVYGMPKAAVQLDAAECSVPLYEIAKKLKEVVNARHDKFI